ncbi:hypothetical protein E7Z59_11780 [Robertkochia marina]|uniref:Uncharacterized protein n=1 Tax=Robertkochia marina TaxID=1227945 RepID=A0A4V3UXY8_9FLAO|nr:hypothetical protein [Robertkochia marina]THD66474.1 hypothetical protein E7Z59_11780 [Robertkochia marina]TRZ44153.1 hypothetical protein D3A96_09595 [Robertkochia marina]
MKKVFNVCIAIGILVLISCNSSSAYKEEMTSLNESWKGATEEVTAFSQEAEKDLNSWKEMYDGMYGDSGSGMEGISEEKKKTLDSLDAVCRRHGDKYRLINQELSELKTSWEQNSQVLSQLNEALENNGLTEEQAKIIPQLNSQVTTAKEQVTIWKSQLEAVKGECEATCQEFANRVKEE